MRIQKPHNMIIGAQKAATTWLWDKMNRHPGTSLPADKEIHIYGGVENCRKGENWYYNHFQGLDLNKVVGDASTTYFYDYLPYWFNPSDELLIEESLPPIPELITSRFPDIKVVISLRDPVERAISAYRHWMTKRTISPMTGLKATAIRYPKFRILEYGFYAKYLEMWKQYIPAERILTIIFETDVIQRPEKTLKKMFAFLNLDPDIQLEAVDQIVHKSWSWNRIVLEYYGSAVTKRLGGRLSNYLAKTMNIFKLSPLNKTDIEFLRSIYLPEKERLEQLIGQRLDCWSYGQDKISGLKRK